MNHLDAADALELPGLQHPQQLHLHGHGEIADLIQKQGSAVSQFKPPGFAELGTGERALLVAEKLAGDDTFGKRAAVSTDEGLPIPFALCLDGPGNHLFPDAGFALDHHNGVLAGNPADLAVYLLHGRCLANEVFEW